MNFCPKCRHKLIVPDFCVECGADLGEYLKKENEGAVTVPQYAASSVNPASDGMLTEGNVLVKYTGKSRTFDIPSGIKEIYNDAFADNDVISAVTIPEGVTVIGKGAFRGCRCLKTVKLPSTLVEIYEEAFMGCRELEEVVIPKNITELRENAFYNCSKLGKITIPAALKSVGRNALHGCNNTMDIHISSLDAWCNISGLINFTESRGQNRLFLLGRLVTTVSISEGITAISDYAFKGCPDITSVSLPRTLKSIGKYAFYGCSICSLMIPGGVTAMGEYSLGYCKNLSHIHFCCNVPGNCGVTYSYPPIGNFKSTMLFGCDKLESVTIAYGVTHIGDKAFSGIPSLRKVELPDTLAVIGSYAFNDCKGLTSITLPYSLKNIGTSAFEGCSELRSIEFPYHLESIGDRAFAGCSCFTEITVPDAVNSIGVGAFAGCKNLTKISIPFTGVNRDSTKSHGTFGIIFGYTPNQREAAAHIEQYVGKTDSLWSSDPYIRYYYNIPATLRTVNVTSATQLSECAFRNCHMLTNIELPSTLCAIKQGAFYGCNGLTRIYIPSKVSEIGKDAFSNMMALTGISVSVENLHFSSESGNLYTKYGDNLLHYAAGQTSQICVLPKSVRRITSRAFTNCNSLVKVILPEFLSVIEDNAFEFCSSLKEITIPQYIASVSRSAFYCCNSLTIKAPQKCRSMFDSDEKVIYY